MTSQHTTIIGLDIGYGDTKAMADSGQRACFPSLVAPAEFIRFQADVGAHVPVNGLTLRDTEEGDLFVGELALRQGRPGAVRSPRDRDRLADPILTHLAHAALVSVLPHVEYARAQIVTGLPVDYYRDADVLATCSKARTTTWASIGWWWMSRRCGWYPNPLVDCSRCSAG